MNKRLIGWHNLVRLACWVLKLLSWAWFDDLRGWSWPALAKKTFWFSPTVNSCIIQLWISVSFGFSNWFQIQMYSFFVAISAKRKPVRLLVPFEETSIGNWLNLAQKCLNRTTISFNWEANLDLCPFSKTDEGFVRNRSLYYM